MAAMSRSTHRQRTAGAVLTETLVLLPVFMLLIFGILDYARMLWTDLVLRHAAAETVRYATVHGSTAPAPASLAELRGVFLDATAGIEAARLTLAMAPDWETGNTPGSTLQLTVTYQFDFLWQFLPAGSTTLQHVEFVQVAQ